MLQTTACRTRRPKKTLTSEAQFTNQKDLLHEEKIAQSWTQDLEIPFQESTQFLALQPSQNEITINRKTGQYAI